MNGIFRSDHISIHENNYDTVIVKIETIPKGGFSEREKEVINTLINSMDYGEDSYVSLLCSEIYYHDLSISFFKSNVSLLVKQKGEVNKTFIKPEEAKEILKSILL
jgi:hypothetical protein